MTLRPGTNWCGNRGEWPYVELATPSSFGCSYVRELFKPSSHGVVRSWIDGLGEEDFTNFSSILRAISCAVEEKEQGGMYAPCSTLAPYVLHVSNPLWERRGNFYQQRPVAMLFAFGRIKPSEALVPFL